MYVCDPNLPKRIQLKKKKLVLIKQKGEKGDGRAGITGMPGLPGTPVSI